MTDLVRDDNGNVVGVHYEKDGNVHTEYGSVIIATGGFAADFSKDGILAKARPMLPDARAPRVCNCAAAMSLARLRRCVRQAPPPPALLLGAGPPERHERLFPPNKP